MKKIKVYLQRPWKFADSSYYKYLVKYPPKEIEFLNVRGDEGAIESGKKMRFLQKIKQTIKKFLSPFSIPNVHLTRYKGEYDLIHCTHCLSLNKKKLWVADIEYVKQLWVSNKPYEDMSENKKIVEKILKRTNCKKILAWTEWVKKDILKFFPEIENKIEIVGFAMPSPEFLKEKTSKIKLLFSSRRFYFKGGLYALEVIDNLTKKYKNVEGIIISDTPNEILEKYKSNKKIKFYDLITQKKLFEEIYPKSDIFIYPSYTDTFGFGFIEAMAFGLPLVGIEGHCNKELITEGKTGFIIPKEQELDLKNIGKKEKKIIDKLQEKTELLIKNKELRNLMSKNGISEVKTGRFSIKNRNEKLKKIYEEILENI